MNHERGGHGGNLPLADSRGINLSMMDRDLHDLTVKARALENQISAMVSDLDHLRQKINGYSKMVMTVEPVQATEPAKGAPQAILPVPEKPEVKKVDKPTPTYTTTTSDKNGIVGVRYGAHKTYTRLVLDINGSTKHTMDFDKEAGIVTITLPNTAWATVKNKTYKSSRVMGYEAQAAGQGTTIAIAVKNADKVKTSTIGATKGNPARIVVDVMG